MSSITFLLGSCFFNSSLFASSFVFCTFFFFIFEVTLTLRVCADLSVREECDEDPNHSDEAEAEMSPPKSPSTPKNVKSKNSGTVHCSVSLSLLWEPAGTNTSGRNIVSEPGAFRGTFPTELALTSWLLLSAVLSI